MEGGFFTTGPPGKSLKFLHTARSGRETTGYSVQPLHFKDGKLRSMEGGGLPKVTQLIRSRSKNPDPLQPPRPLLSLQHKFLKVF